MLYCVEHTYFHRKLENFVGVVIKLEKVKTVVHDALFSYHETPLLNFFRNVVVQHQLRLWWVVETGYVKGEREKGGVKREGLEKEKPQIKS